MYERQEIYVKDDLKPLTKASVIMHEVLHAIDDYAELDEFGERGHCYRTDEVETIIKIHSRLWTDVLNKNPKLHLYYNSLFFRE